jgi:hypothetical protein
MRTRLLVMIAIMTTSVPVGGAALAHAGHDGGHERKSSHRAPTRFPFELTGSQVPGGGDPRGRGNALLTLDPDNDVVCLRADWQRLAGEVTAIHLHRGPAGKNGPHHIEILNDESLAGEWNRVELCVKVAGGHGHGEVEGHDAGSDPDPVRAVGEDPSNFYVNVHSTAHKDGAIRGQIAE